MFPGEAQPVAAQTQERHRTAGRGPCRTRMPDGDTECSRRAGRDWLALARRDDLGGDIADGPSAVIDQIDPELEQSDDSLTRIRHFTEDALGGEPQGSTVPLSRCRLRKAILEA